MRLLEELCTNILVITIAVCTGSVIWSKSILLQLSKVGLCSTFADVLTCINQLISIVRISFAYDNLPFDMTVSSAVLSVDQELPRRRHMLIA